MNTCSIQGCTKPVHGRDFCMAHYLRWYRHGDPLAGGSSKGVAQKFLDQAIAHEGDDCLIWPFYRTKEGYGGINKGGRCRIVSRVVCEAVHGPPPFEGAQAAHSCGNGHLGCVSAKHIRWATYQENREDMIAHGRSLRGERSHYATLKAKEVKEIRKRLKQESQRLLAKEYGVTPSAITSIATGRSWGWLE